VKVVLRADVARLGKKGDVREVANGYGRNFLRPRGLALVASDGAEAQAESMRRNRQAADARAREDQGLLAQKLRGQTLVIESRANKDRLFGSVTANHIAKAIMDRFGLAIDVDHIGLVEPIKSTGSFEVPVELGLIDPFSLTVEVTGLKK
jgi:large subunit ribosomal protein L9